MNIPEEFGKYLLLKKLTEDALGETFRAGRLGQEGMEQVVLLRVFNGKGMDGEKLWQKASGRAEIQQVLRSPNIGSGVDLGRVRSYPYVAYDYISGKNLATLLSQAARQFSPVPGDHALLIAERISLALAAAYETRAQDERVMHGFVVPHLVMVSNEGETRLLGFEVAPGLRELAAGTWNDGEIARYLSPETLAGAPLSKADDVYSMGAILFELLTGEQLPTAPAEGYGALIDGATLGNEGTALPAPVAALLKKSLVAREQRIADAATWHKTLSKLMIDGHYSPTTFNLAFFMHNLFREEIERESQEIQAEKTLEISPRAAASLAAASATTVAIPIPPAAAAARDLREATGVREATWPGIAGGAAPMAGSAQSSKKGLWIGLAAVLVAALGAGGYFAFGRGEKPAPAAAGPAATDPGVAAQPAVPLDPAAAAAPAGPSPEELQAQIQQMFEARSKEMEAKLKTQYDDRIKQLQQQLADSKKPGDEPARERPVPPPVQTEPTPVETRASTARPEPPVPAPAQTTPPSVPPSSSGATNPANDDRPGTVAQQPASPAPSNPQPASPAKPQVQYGDLVQPGAGVVSPKVKSQPTPRYPTAAQKLGKSAAVDVRVLVDERGQVADAERIGAKAGFGFDDAALETARRTTFVPASKDGVRVKMWTVLKIAFKR